MTTHGMSGSRIYRTWKNIHGRCEYAKDKAFKYYGGKGVKVCSEWRNFIPFRDWALVNGYQENLTIDRIDSNGNYEPKNCRWVTQAEQNYNKGMIQTMKKGKKVRLPADFNRALNTKVHPDGEAARERLAEMFNGQYKKYEMDTFAYLAFEQMIRATKAKKGDDLEAIFNIQAKA